VVCGYPIYSQGYYNSEYNHYLFDWRSGDDVLKDYLKKFADRETCIAYLESCIENVTRQLIQISLI